VVAEPLAHANYIEALLAREISRDSPQSILQPPPRTLSLLLRHSMLLEYTTAASGR
jgi:hypothetical protein